MKYKLNRLSLPEKQEVIKRLAALAKRQREVVFAYLYGSFIEDVPFHDIDIGIYVSGIGKVKAGPFTVEFAHSLSKELGFDVDVRVLNFAPVSFVYHVICGQVFFDRVPEVRTRIIESSIQRYLDIKPVLHWAMKEAFAT
jgi:predicted nucleotidyltransferase